MNFAALNKKLKAQAKALNIKNAPSAKARRLLKKITSPEHMKTMFELCSEKSGNKR